ncbi:MAG: acetyl-CoA decarbonylase/synthase complex subunit delta [Methanomassiliicoccales archaeon]
MAEVPIPKEKWSGKIGEVTLGATEEDGGPLERKVTVGGQTGMPFLSFENEYPNRPTIAGEVMDTLREFPELAKEPFGDALQDPVEWARKWIEEYDADLICLRLLSTNPEEEDTSSKEAAELVKRMIEEVKVPLIVYGCEHEEKDAKTMEEVSNIAPDARMLMAQAEEESYKSVSAAAMANRHAVVGFSNLDINLAKQISILLTDFGVQLEDIVADPLMAALGMGLEYSYSVNERIRLAALMGDKMLQTPMVCDASTGWDAREATDEETPGYGDVHERVVWWEFTTALAALLSGADMLIMRSPYAVKMVNEAVDDLLGGD